MDERSSATLRIAINERTCAARNEFDLTPGIPVTPNTNSAGPAVQFTYTSRQTCARGPA